MASIYDLKPRFQALLRPTIRALAAAHVTPNVVTLVALVGSATVGVAIAMNPDAPAVLLLLPAWLFVRMALNAIDGMMARELEMSTSLGAVLNEVGDVLSDFFLYAPLAVIAPAATWHIVGFSIGAMLTEFCGVVTRALGGTRRYDGPMGKSDRAFAVGAVALLTFAAPEVRQHWSWIFAALGGLTLLTCTNRIQRGLAELRIEKPA